MGLGIPRLKFKILLEPNPLKSIVLALRLAVWVRGTDVNPNRAAWVGRWEFDGLRMHVGSSCTNRLRRP